MHYNNLKGLIVLYRILADELFPKQIYGLRKLACLTESNYMYVKLKHITKGYLSPKKDKLIVPRLGLQ